MPLQRTIALSIRKRSGHSATVPYEMFGSLKAWSSPNIATAKRPPTEVAYLKLTAI